MFLSEKRDTVLNGNWEDELDKETQKLTYVNEKGGARK
jgi:hypothetical protein